MSDGKTEPEPGRLRALFEAALEQPTTARAAWIAANTADADERGTLERLVAADAVGDVLATPAAELAARIGVDEEEAQAESLIGRRIDRFRLVRLLGQGGMASVFLGEREDADFTQQVAIKLLRRGLYSELEQRLFRRERQALAMLSHPNIAHLLDGGVTEAGIPYLVMDYIDGAPITQYANDRRLDLPARLKLFATVCRAVDAAHRQLIVHRDLKPSNILVDAQGEAKLLDFGIAKLLDEDDDATRSGLAALTPDYAAPEQYGGGPISTATDVYALGVVLHELLLGARPERGTTKRPSALKAALRGDLDNIILKALAAEPDRRYALAGAFAEDIERYLDGQPVAAHPPSWRYRTRKFVRRHRAGVIVTALATVGLVVGASLVLWQSSVARREAERATQEAGRASREAESATRQAERAEAMRSFLSDAFAEAEPSTPRAGPPSIVQVVEQAIARLRTDARMHVGVRTELLTQLGSVLQRQGQMERATQLLQETYDQARQQFGANDALTLAAGDGLAHTHMGAGKYADARRLLDHLLAGAPAGNVIRASLLRNSASLATLQNELSRARADASESVRLSRQLDDEKALALALAEVGNVQMRMNDPASAAATFEEVLTLVIKLLGPKHASVAYAHSSLSRAYRELDELDRAESHMRLALEIARSSFPKDHYGVAYLYNALAVLQNARRDFTNALRSSEEALRITRVVYGADSHLNAMNLNNVGLFHVVLEDYAAAIGPLRESLRLNTTQFGAEHYETAIVRANYGVALARDGDGAGGDAELRHALRSLDSAAEPNAERQAEVLEKFARLKLESGDLNAAVSLIERFDTVVQRLKTPGKHWVGKAQTMRADALLRLGRARDAAAQLHAAASAMAQLSKSDPVLAIEVPLLQALAARALGDTAASDKALGLLAALRHPPPRLRSLAQRLREGSAPSSP